MNPKQKEKTILIFLLFLLLIINYPFLDKAVTNFLDESQIAKVTRIIDGDTIEVELDNDLGNKTNVRLLGINTPERGETGYDEAKEYLEKEILNETVRLEFSTRGQKYDRYGRLLGYVYTNNRNINLEVVEKGFGNYYFPSGKDQKYDNFVNAWETCLNNEKNLCEPSGNICSECFELTGLNVKSQELTLFNSCSYDCDLTDWEMKDEGRKKFVFPRTIMKEDSYLHIVIGDGESYENILYWSGENYVWTESGDSVLLRDTKGNLVLFYTY